MKWRIDKQFGRDSTSLFLTVLPMLCTKHHIVICRSHRSLLLCQIRGIDIFLLIDFIEEDLNGCLRLTEIMPERF